MNLLTKLRLLAQLNTTEKEVEDGIKMKNSTKIVGAIFALLTAVVQVPEVQAGILHFVMTHPAVSSVMAGLTGIFALIHNPKATAAVVLVTALLLSPGAYAQVAPTPNPISNLYGAGASYSVNATPAIAGTALYAHLLNDSGTYAFTAVDAVPNTLKPLTVTSNVGAGVAQKVATFGKIPVYMPTAVGVSWSGSNTGWQWNGGVIAAIHIKGQYFVLPSVRFLKSSVSNGSGYQPILGLLFGWGN